MELIKSNIHMSRIKDRKTTQITLDDDFIVQDVKPDVEDIIANKTEIVIDSIKVLEGKIVVKGKLTYMLLCSGAEQSGLYGMDGSIPFEEVINMDEVCENDTVSVEHNLEDISVTIINSRKVNVKAIVSFTASCETIYDEDAVVDVNADENTDYIKKPLEIIKLMVSKKDIYRIKEEVEIPSNKPNVGKVLWNSVNGRNIQIKLLDDKMSISGEIILFVMYEPEEEQMPLQWVENIIPFNGVIDMPGVNQNMIPNISTRLTGIEPEVYKDYDGENRLIRLDEALEMDIKVYEEEQIDIITDIYSPHTDLVKTEKKGCFESLLIHNQSRHKASERFKIDVDNSHIMQICNSSGNIKIDDMIVVEDGIRINGIIDANTVYISSDDKSPVRSEAMILPFEYTIEAKGINKNSKFFIRPSIENMTASMVSTDEIEIKAAMVFDTIVLNALVENVISDVTEKPVDMEKLKQMPGMVIHIVEPGENLWIIAKKFYTTVNNIREINHLQGENVKPGDKLLLVKQVAIGTAI